MIRGQVSEIKDKAKDLKAKMDQIKDDLATKIEIRIRIKIEIRIKISQGLETRIAKEDLVKVLVPEEVKIPVLKVKMPTKNDLQIGFANSTAQIILLGGKPVLSAKPVVNHVNRELKDLRDLKAPKDLKGGLKVVRDLKEVEASKILDGHEILNNLKILRTQIGLVGLRVLSGLNSLHSLKVVTKDLKILDGHKIPNSLKIVKGHNGPRDHNSLNGLNSLSDLNKNPQVKLI